MILWIFKNLFFINYILDIRAGKLNKKGDEGTSFITYLFSLNNLQHINV